MGNIQESVSDSPAKNFQANYNIVGAEIYHSDEGRIRITDSAWGDPLNDEVIGDSIIVVYEGQRSMYISDEARADVFAIINAAKRHSLMVDGVLYSLMSHSGGEPASIPDSYSFLGVVASAVPIDELPTENLQANRDVIVGASVYKLPFHENNDIVVFHTADSRYYFQRLQ